MKKVIEFGSAVALTCIAVCAVSSPAYAADDVNLAAAKAQYKVAASSVIEAEDGDIDTALRRAGEIATTQAPKIVHVPAGSYTLSNCRVPANVILVSAPGANYTLVKRVAVSGSIYGGSFNAKGSDTRAILFNSSSYAFPNGIVEKATVQNDKSKGNYGIVATGNTRGVVIRNNVVSNCFSGINVFFGANVTSIEGNTVFGNAEAGVNIVKADVSTIKSNTIRNNGKHGISTDMESAGSGKAHCYIGTIQNNAISNNGGKGIYVETNCHVLHVKGNRITGNESGIGVSVKDGTKAAESTYVNDVQGNTISKNRSENIVAYGKKATVVLGKSNKITNATKGNGITISKGGVVKITGKGNKITGNKKNGISLVKKSTLVLKGKKTVISKNRNMGIGVYGKSKATVKNVSFSKNKKFAAYAEKGSKLKISKTNGKTKSGAKNRIYKA